MFVLSRKLNYFFLQILKPQLFFCCLRAFLLQISPFKLIFIFRFHDVQVPRGLRQNSSPASWDQADLWPKRFRTKSKSGGDQQTQAESSKSQHCRQCFPVSTIILLLHNAVFQNSVHIKGRRKTAASKGPKQLAMRRMQPNQEALR
jgi:hypothetical protein